MGLMLFRQIPLQNSTCNKRLGIDVLQILNFCLINEFHACIPKSSNQNVVYNGCSVLIGCFREQVKNRT